MYTSAAAATAAAIVVVIVVFSLYFHYATVLNFLCQNNVLKLFLYTVMYEYFDQECFFSSRFLLILSLSSRFTSCEILSHFVAVQVYKSRLCARGICLFICFFFSFFYSTQKPNDDEENVQDLIHIIICHKDILF